MKPFLALLAFVLAAAPLGARADLYVNLINGNPQKLTSRCVHRWNNHKPPTTVVVCTGDAEITATQMSGGYPQKYCIVSVWWSTGDHWHYNFTKNAGCTGYWQNSNTLDVTIKK